MPQSVQKRDPRFSYGEYLQWTGDERWELIDGVPYLMSPAPTPQHQRLAGRLFTQLSNQLEGHPCEPFVAPIDVRLPFSAESDDKVLTVVQPDILVVCDKAKIDDKGVRGAPDFIIEILSPSTAWHDSEVKSALYASRGVREYWTVDPDHQTVVVHLNSTGRKWGELRTHASKGKLTLTAMPGITIDLNLVFQQ